MKSEDPLKEVYEKNDESLKQLFSVSQQIHMVKNLLNDLQNERNKLIIEAAENGIRPVSIARVAEMNDSWVGTIIKRVSHHQEIVGGQ